MFFQSDSSRAVFLGDCNLVLRAIFRPLCLNRLVHVTLFLVANLTLILGFSVLTGFSGVDHRFGTLDACVVHHSHAYLFCATIRPMTPNGSSSRVIPFILAGSDG